MQTYFFNLQQFAPLLGKETELERDDFLRRVKETGKEKSQTLLSVIAGLQFFRVIKDHLGRILFT